MSANNETPSDGVRQRHTSPRLKIKITAEIIAVSVRRHSGHCFIAESIKAAYPHFRNVSVDLATIRASDPEKRLRYTWIHPRIGQVAIIEFDRGTVPEPFEMTLWHAVQITRGSWGSSRKGTKQSPKPAGDGGSDAGRFPSLGKAQLQKETGGNSPIPTVIGGRPPPAGLLLGRGISGEDSGAYYAPGNVAKRRAFGVRMLRY